MKTKVAGWAWSALNHMHWHWNWYRRINFLLRLHGFLYDRTDRYLWPDDGGLDRYDA